MQLWEFIGIQPWATPLGLTSQQNHICVPVPLLSCSGNFAINQQILAFQKKLYPIEILGAFYKSDPVLILSMDDHYYILDSFEIQKLHLQRSPHPTIVIQFPNVDLMCQAQDPLDQIVQKIVGWMRQSPKDLVLDVLELNGQSFVPTARPQVNLDFLPDIHLEQVFSNVVEKPVDLQGFVDAHEWSMENLQALEKAVCLLESNLISHV